jgi:hypothetical protein
MAERKHHREVPLARRLERMTRPERAGAMKAMSLAAAVQATCGVLSKFNAFFNRGALVAVDLEPRGS